MFGLSMHGCASQSINSHAEAIAFFEACPTTRGMRDGEHRAIKGKEGSRTMGVRLQGGSVYFRYHRTDVVVWHSDGSYAVDLTYDSPSTCEFANRFVPHYHYATKSGDHYVVGDTIYPARCELRVAPDGAVTGMRHRFTKLVVDRARAKRALAGTNYAAYLAWHKVMWPMVGGGAKPKWWRDEAIEHCLKDEGLWHKLMMSRTGNPAVIREHFYRTNYVYQPVFADTLPANKENKQWTLS